MQGYLYPENMNHVFDEEGYFKTGDIASVDEHGDVVIYDRRKDLIISGGENIYPYEIESVAKSHPFIADAMCTSITDSAWGNVRFYTLSQSNGCQIWKRFLKLV